MNFDRHRRLRSSANMRALVRETHLRAEDFIYPLFIVFYCGGGTTETRNFLYARDLSNLTRFNEAGAR